MATSALSVSNVKQKLVTAYFEGARQSVGLKDPTWMQTYDWRTDRDVNQIQTSAMTGVPSFSTWDEVSAISPSGITSLDPKNMTYVLYAGCVTFGPLTPNEIPNYRESCMAKLGFSAASTMYELQGVAKAAAFTSSSGNHAVHGSKTLIASDHETASGTRSNKFQSAFDRATYMSVRSGFSTWTNYQGQVYDLSGAGLTVEYHPANDEAVRQAILSPVTSSQGQINLAALDNEVQFVKNPYMTDTDDVLVQTRIPGERALVAWERYPLSFWDGSDDTKLQDRATVIFAVGFGNKGVPDGIFGITAD